ncbi:hypothetical protein PV721_37130 [Streptomyces sp. MB09-01]|uniref:hypothetical protein n=1 Tax=Streptomyces sp. MB09-01 TaxID=3028666 RepID=UPI0029A358BC|nr:hypothetical protein [Streptomyces sp. MB09-01]MDX3539847.1 hypothetical protein [Streptomyces sp. MB09-01]
MTTPQNPTDREPFVSLHTAVVLLAAILIGLTAGGLTFLGGSGAALGVLAGLAAAGGAVPVLRTLIR